jgi:hypothetical protein
MVEFYELGNKRKPAPKWLVTLVVSLMCFAASIAAFNLGG